MDLCSMLFARTHVFNLDKTWYAHIRVDSSPQFCRDYFMAECDLVCPSGISTWGDLGHNAALVSRLLVGQGIGARAANVTIKTRKLLHSLALDSRPM